MNAPGISGFDWFVILVVGGVMWGGLLFFAKRWMNDVDRRIAAETDARQARERELSNAINSVGNRLDDFRLKVAAECINHDRLAEAMRPVMERLDGFRSDIKELFQLVHTKQDRRGGD